MVLCCPVCMTIAPVGTSYCVNCSTSLAGVVPIPASVLAQDQQQDMMSGLGNMMQGNVGKYAMGAPSGANAGLGEEMLWESVENSSEEGINASIEGLGEEMLWESVENSSEEGVNASIEKTEKKAQAMANEDIAIYIGFTAFQSIIPPILVAVLFQSG
jgi:hypothetical protein